MTGVQKIDALGNRERLDILVNSNGLDKIEINEVFDFNTHIFYEYIPLTKECGTHVMPDFDLSKAWTTLTDPTSGQTVY